MDADKTRVACVGAGYWGKNLVRNFQGLSNASLVCVCDVSDKIRSTVQQQYPDMQVTGSYNDVLENPDIDAVVLAVPAIDHFEAAKQALLHKKHVYVEKPMTLRVEDAEQLVVLGDQQNRVLMVGHLMEYHPAVQMLKELIDQDELGDLYYLYLQRLNLGIVRKDENALWSLAPHDVSIALHLLGQEPDSVSAHGECYLQKGIEDVVFVNLHFADKKMVQIHVSWLDPHKIRRLTVVGNKKMAVFDDAESTEKIRIYDKSADLQGYESYGDAITLRFGDVTIPHLDMSEPLRLECQHFVDCIQEGSTPVSDGRDGLRVVRVLEAAQQSLEQNGAPVQI